MLTIIISDLCSVCEVFYRLWGHRRSERLQHMNYLDL